MEHDDLCSILIEKYYDAIYKYCYAVLQHDEQAAMDCTQEIFFLMFRKKAVLNLRGNMRVWLYKAADRVMRYYIRKEQRYCEQIPIDEIEIADPNAAPDSGSESLRDRLTAEEYTLTSWEDAQFTAVFMQEQLLYSLFTEGMDQQEALRILNSFFA